MKTIQEFVSENNLVVVNGGVDKKGNLFSFGIVGGKDISSFVGDQFSGARGIYTLAEDRKYGLQLTLRSKADVAGM